MIVFEIIVFVRFFCDNVVCDRNGSFFIVDELYIVLFVINIFLIWKCMFWIIMYINLFNLKILLFLLNIEMNMIVFNDIELIKSIIMILRIN